MRCRGERGRGAVAVAVGQGSRQIENHRHIARQEEDGQGKNAEHGENALRRQRGGPRDDLAVFGGADLPALGAGQASDKLPTNVPVRPGRPARPDSRRNPPTIRRSPPSP